MNERRRKLYEKGKQNPKTKQVYSINKDGLRECVCACVRVFMRSICNRNVSDCGCRAAFSYTSRPALVFLHHPPLFAARFLLSFFDLTAKLCVSFLFFFVERTKQKRKGCSISKRGLIVSCRLIKNKRRMRKTATLVENTEMAI